MKKLLIVTFASLILIGCNEKSHIINYDEYTDKNIENSCTRFTYMNHSYLRFEEVYKYSVDRYHYDNPTGFRMSIVHDPDCICYQKTSVNNTSITNRSINSIESPVFQIPSTK